MTTTPINLLPLLPGGAAAVDTPVNDAFAIIDVFLNTGVISRTTDAEPGAPSEGDKYIMTASASGSAWDDFPEDYIAAYLNGAWYAFAPRDRCSVWVDDENRRVYWNGTAFVTDGSLLLDKIDATVDPGATDDDGSGYSVGSHWFNVTADRAFVCLDASTAAAIWTQVGSVDALARVQSNLAASAAPTVDDDVDLGYGIGSTWWDGTNDEIYLCIDATDGAAVWIQVGSGSGGGLVASVQTGAYEITESEDVGVDSTGGTLTVDLKASPDSGDVAYIHDVASNCGTTAVTIGRNGSTIRGLSEDASLDDDNGGFWFIFDGSTWQFTPITNGGLSQAQVDARVALYQPSSGTFTPYLVDDSLSAAEGQSASEEVGYYRKTGDVVDFWIMFTSSSLGTLTTSQWARLAGLPFTSIAGLSPSVHCGLAQGLAITAGQTVSGYVVPNADYIQLTVWDVATGTTNLLISELSADGRVFLSGSYIAS